MAESEQKECDHQPGQVRRDRRRLMLEARCVKCGRRGTHPMVPWGEIDWQDADWED